MEIQCRYYNKAKLAIMLGRCASFKGFGVIFLEGSASEKYTSDILSFSLIGDVVTAVVRFIDPRTNKFATILLSNNDKYQDDPIITFGDFRKQTNIMKSLILITSYKISSLEKRATLKFKGNSVSIQADIDSEIIITSKKNDKASISTKSVAALETFNSMDIKLSGISWSSTSIDGSKRDVNVEGKELAVLKELGMLLNKALVLTALTSKGERIDRYVMPMSVIDVVYHNDGSIFLKSGGVRNFSNFTICSAYLSDITKSKVYNRFSNKQMGVE